MCVCVCAADKVYGTAEAVATVKSENRLENSKPRGGPDHTCQHFMGSQETNGYVMCPPSCHFFFKNNLFDKIRVLLNFY